MPLGGMSHGAMKPLRFVKPDSLHPFAQPLIHPDGEWRVGGSNRGNAVHGGDDGVRPQRQGCRGFSDELSAFSNPSFPTTSSGCVG